VIYVQSIGRAVRYYPHQPAFTLSKESKVTSTLTTSRSGPSYAQILLFHQVSAGTAYRWFRFHPNSVQKFVDNGRHNGIAVSAKLMIIRRLGLEE
jgi:hypothetical protein